MHHVFIWSNDQERQGRCNIRFWVRSEWVAASCSSVLHAGLLGNKELSASSWKASGLHQETYSMSTKDWGTTVVGQTCLSFALGPEVQSSGSNGEHVRVCIIQQTLVGSLDRLGSLWGSHYGLVLSFASCGISLCLVLLILAGLRLCHQVYLRWRLLSTTPCLWTNSSFYNRLRHGEQYLCHTLCSQQLCLWNFAKSHGKYIHSAHGKPRQHKSYMHAITKWNCWSHSNVSRTMTHL